jgi:hypothetical protein
LALLHLSEDLLKEQVLELESQSVATPRELELVMLNQSAVMLSELVSETPNH